MLRVVLIEMRLGRSQPCDWFRDVRENTVLQWAAFGIRPSRTCWYDFADRMAPLLDAWNATVLKVAKERGVTRAERGSLDGSFVAANASRHHLLNEKTLGQHMTELEKTCQADEANQPPQEVPSWMAKNPGTRQSQRQRYLQAAERLVELHAINDRQEAKQRRKREKVVVSVSDPAAALGRDKYNVFRPLYNLQLLRDLDSPLYLAYQVFAQTTDAGTVPSAGTAEQDFDRRIAHDLAGRCGLCKHLYPCPERTNRNYPVWSLARKRLLQSDRRKARSLVRSVRNIFIWDAEHERCIVARRAIRCHRSASKRRRQADDQINIMHSYRMFCQKAAVHALANLLAVPIPNVAARSNAVSTKTLIEVPSHACMATPEAKAIYKLRKQTVELAFADLKQQPFAPPILRAGPCAHSATSWLGGPGT